MLQPMTQTEPEQQLPALAVTPLLIVVMLKLALHFACLEQYGLFHDELSFPVRSD